MNINDPTPYPDINDVLAAFSGGLEGLLADNLIGLYLFGSLTYGDFNPARSDIDLVAILHHPASPQELETIRQRHVETDAKYPTWANRMECSYLPAALLPNILPPALPRPYFGEGTLYPEAHYGNEWIINLYLLYHSGIALSGPDFKSLVGAVDIVEVQKACIRDLFQEWEPKLSDPAWLDNPHYQSYLVLNLCRILYTVLCASTGSKTVSADWVKKHFSQWQTLIRAAENWGYGMDMNHQDETLGFITFVIAQVKNTPLYAPQS